MMSSLGGAGGGGATVATDEVEVIGKNIVDGFDLGNLEGVVKAGWLRKQGQHNSSTWNLRFFCLFKDRLAYYRDVKNINELIPLRTLVFTADINCRETTIPGLLKDHKFCFEIRTPFDQSMIEAASEEERHSWIVKMNDLMSVYKDSLCGYMRLDFIIKEQATRSDYFFILHKDSGILLMFQDHENTTNALHDITMDRNTKISLHMDTYQIKVEKSVILSKSTGLSATSNDIKYAIAFEINKADIKRWYDMMMAFIKKRIKEEEDRLTRVAAEEEARRIAAEEAERRRIAFEEEARRKAVEEEAGRKVAEEEAKKKAEQEAIMKAEEEDARRKQRELFASCVYHAELFFFVVSQEGLAEWQEGTIVLCPSKILVALDCKRIIHEFFISPSSAVFDATKLLDPIRAESYFSFGFSCGAGKILHVLTRSEDLNSLWINHILAQIPSADYLNIANPALAVHQDAIALIEKDKFYEIYLQELKAIGVCLVNCNNLVVVSQLNNDAENGMKKSSILTRMYGKKVKHNYEAVAEALRNWKPPMGLQFRLFPERSGDCMLYRPSEGSTPSSNKSENWCLINLTISEGGVSFKSLDGVTTLTKTGTLLEKKILLAGASILIYGTGYTLLSYGYETFLLKFTDSLEAKDWSAIVFHGISLANGGRHLLQYNKTDEAEEDLIEESVVEITAVEIHRNAPIADSISGGGGGVVVEEEEQGDLADMDDIRRLFFAYVNYAKEKFEYIYLNPMQFSTIWRMVSGERGNLFKEMQTFTRFNKKGNAAMSEEEFVEGWISLCVELGKLGRHYLIIIKKLVGKNNVLL